MGQLQASNKVSKLSEEKTKQRLLNLKSFIEEKGKIFGQQRRQRRVGNLNLEEMKQEIENLVVIKGFYNTPKDIPKKLLFAFIELGEASDAWKKGEAEEKIAEELIDVIFYVLDASRLVCPTINMDEMFRKKLEKNLGRPFQYGEGHRNKQF